MACGLGCLGTCPGLAGEEIVSVCMIDRKSCSCFFFSDLTHSSAVSAVFSGHRSSTAWCNSGGWRSVAAIPLVPVLCRLQIAASLCGFPVVADDFQTVSNCFSTFEIILWYSIMSMWMMQNFNYSGRLEWDYQYLPVIKHGNRKWSIIISNCPMLNLHS